MNNDIFNAGIKNWENKTKDLEKQKTQRNQSKNEKIEDKKERELNSIIDEVL